MNLADENGVAALLVRYGFDLGGQSALVLVRSWSAKYDPSWLQIAIVESLHLGRYKAVSVEQVLNNWQRRGNIAPHFSTEFAGMITGQDETVADRPDHEAEMAEESILDEEIALLFSASKTGEAPGSLGAVVLSDPALDEGSAEPPLEVPHQLFISAQHQVFLDLTPTDYPPSQPRPPQSQWSEPEPLAEVFMPSAQVSQFYYKLRAMAVPVQPHFDESPLAADG